MDQQLSTTESFSIQDVEMLEGRELYQGFFKAKEYKFRHRLFAGGWSEVITREVFERGHAAALLPYDVQRDQIVLVEQFRVGALETSDEPWLLELVAGIIETKESAQDVVVREAVEEAGIQVTRSMPMLSCLVSPGGTSEKIDLYIGEVDASTAQGLHGLAHEGEDIRVHVVSREQAYQWVIEGKINNAATIIGLQWLQLNLDKVKQNWLTRE